jgi:opacity protein-like surface antigen
MKRFACVVSCVLFALLAAATAARAQAQAGSDSSRYYAEFVTAATLGHKSSGSVGGEGGYHLMGPYTIFFEAGHMANVGTKDLDNRAALIANAVGATFSTSYKITYYDVGLRYKPTRVFRVFQNMLYPYLAVGVGVAHVRSETELAVNGTTVDPLTLGVQFGADLDGSVNKALLVIGGGVTYPFMRRYFVDGSYRYGHIFARTSVIDDDKGINTSRLQIGVGVRF